MASFEQLKELFKNQEVKEGQRREKEKEEEERKRKEDKEEVKEVIRSQMLSIQENIKEIKVKQGQIEEKVLESEIKMAKKYNDMAVMVGNLELRIKEMEVKETARKEEVEVSDKTFPALQPVGKMCSSFQPVGRTRPAFQPEGREQLSCQPADQGVSSLLQPGQVETNKQIYSVVRQARKTIGFSPITSKDIKEVMDEMRIKNPKVGMEEGIKDFLRGEMAMPEEVIDKLQFSRIFRRAGEERPDNDKLFVEFAEDNMPTIVFKYVRKMRSQCNVLTFIPEAFRERAGELEKVAYGLRHSTPSYNTKIRWGWGDLILEKKVRGSREPYRSVHLTDLPPVDLMATPRERLTTPTSSPAPGRKKRSKSQESPNLTNQDFQ